MPVDKVYRKVAVAVRNEVPGIALTVSNLFLFTDQGKWEKDYDLPQEIVYSDSGQFAADEVVNRHGVRGNAEVQVVNQGTLMINFQNTMDQASANLNGESSSVIVGNVKFDLDTSLYNDVFTVTVTAHQAT